MKILLIDYEGEYVIFQAEYGQGIGRLQGSKQGVGTKLYVELGIEAVLRWGIQIAEKAEQIPRIKREADQNIITAQIESIDPDGVLFLRIGPDATLMVEVTDSPQALAAGSYVQLITSDLTLWDMRL